MRSRIISAILASAMTLSLVGCNFGTTSQETSESEKVYVFSDEAYAFISDSNLKFVQQDGLTKVYEKSELDESNGTIIEIDPSKTYQTIDGFGASFTDASAYLLSQMPEEDVDKAMTALFDNEEGIGLSIIRNPIGACDFSLEYYTYDDMPEGQEDWELAYFDGSKAEPQIKLTKQAMSVNPDIKLFLAPWTAPPWMKTKGDYTGAYGGVLRRECYEVYADYLVKCVKMYEDQDVPVYSLTAQNEMFLNAQWAGMVWEWEEIADFINYDLRPALTEAGLETKILNLDHNWSYHEEADNIMAATLDTADGVAYHWYNGEPEDMESTASYFPNKLIYVSEASSSRPVSTGAYIDITSSIARSLRAGANGYVLWNMALLPTGGPALYDTALTNSGVLTCDLEEGVINYESEYYALAHFSKYMHKGAVRVESTDTGIDNNYKLVNVVTLNPNGTMTAVITNDGKTDEVCKFVMGDSVMEVNVSARSTVTLTWDANNY